MAGSEWIALITIPPATAAKIRRKHNVEPYEIDEAVRLGAARYAKWHNHAVYGRRLLVHGVTYVGRPLMVILEPVDRTDGIWECKTAMEWRKA